VKWLSDEAARGGSNIPVRNLGLDITVREKGE
jgi:hypothetical protein